MIALATITARQVDLIFAGAVVVWLAVAGVVAIYAAGKGFPWFPVFVGAFAFSWPLALLLVALAAGPKKEKSPQGQR